MMGSSGSSARLILTGINFSRDESASKMLVSGISTIESLGGHGSVPVPEAFAYGQVGGFWQSIDLSWMIVDHSPQCLA